METNNKKEELQEIEVFGITEEELEEAETVEEEEKNVSNKSE